MRARTGLAALNVAALASAVQRLREPPASEQLAAYALAEGPRCAAWLVWRMRSRLHRVGEVDFRVPGEEPTPYWFRVAVEHLKTRPGWAVLIYEERGERRVRLTWRRFGDQWPESRVKS